MTVVPSVQIVDHIQAFGSIAVEGLEYRSWEDALSELKIKRVDALKVDIEGFEWSMLDAWKRRDNLPDQLALEVSTCNLLRHFETMVKQWCHILTLESLSRSTLVGRVVQLLGIALGVR